MSDDDLALFFEKLFDHYPTEPASRRIVAFQEGEVIGTLSMKWNVNSTIEKKKLPTWKSFSSFGTWYVHKLFIGLALLNHKPQIGECYIADVVVHPDHRSKGVGRLLFEWAQQFAEEELRVNRLSLHVSGKNPRARQLYEQLSFHTQSQENSIMRHFVFNELKWHFMVLKLKNDFS